MRNKRAYLIGILIALLVQSFFFIGFRFGRGKAIYAMFPNRVVFVGDLLCFEDFTPGVNQWKWELGNADDIDQRKGCYRYNKSGKYLIRLTLNHDYEWQAFFPVTVVDTVIKPVWKMIDMDGPDRAFQGEYVQFRMLGVEDQVSWYVNETSVGFCKENTCTYKFNLPGNYKIKVLMDTDTVVYSHAITILDSTLHYIVI